MHGAVKSVQHFIVYVTEDSGLDKNFADNDDNLVTHVH